MRYFLSLLIAAVAFGLFVYTCTAPEREAYEKIDNALEESQRYTDKVSGLAEQIVEICIDYEEEDSIPLDSIYRIASDIEEERNGAISILEEAQSDHNQMTYNDGY